MKKIISITLIVLSSSAFVVKAQTNLVENPSFEIYNNCPDASNELQYATGWNAFDLSPDYFNACSTYPQFSVPYNWGGYQQAASGVAYSAFGAYQSPYYGGLHNIREFIGGTLLSNLVIGTKYYVSIKVSLSLSDTIAANCAINNLGATFSTIPYTWNHPAPITNNPKIYEDSIITDTTDWTRIFGSFIADSVYKYIIIGNFFDDAHTDTLILDSSEYKNCFAYYYLDDICVSTDSIYALNYTDTTVTSVDNISKNLSLNIFPNPTNQILNLTFNGLITGPAILIMDITGRRIMSYATSGFNTSMQIDVSSLMTGMYFISVNMDNINVIQKFIKQ